MKKLFILLALTVFISGNAFSQIEINSIGNVGIGTPTPPFKLSLKVNGIGFSHEAADTVIRIGTYVDSTYGAYIQTHTNHPLNFATNNSLAQMTIIPSGNIGIGITTPTTKLDVNGKLRVRDVSNDNTKDSVLVVSGDGTVSYRDASTLSQKTSYTNGTATPIVRICCESWMTKNLDVDTYRNGDPIPHVSDTIAWAALTTGAYCYYANDSATYAAVYGKLYNWYAVNDPRGLAPEGWHVPTDFEWTTLENCLGGASVAGGLMKETGTTNWNSPNTAASNISGFTCLPGGSRVSVGSPFINVGNNGSYWSSTENNTTNAWNRNLYYNGGNVYRNNFNKNNGFSVRCLRD